MQIRPIFASLRKHRIPAFLIVLEIALACAVLCNAVFMIGQRVTDMRLPNGIDENGIVVVNVRGANPKLAADTIPRNLSALRAMPGVKAAAAINTLPLTHNAWDTAFNTKPGERMSRSHSVGVAEYLVTPGIQDALGLKLLQGRYFTRQEYAVGKLGKSYMPQGHAAVVTRALAERMWPGRTALGKVLYMGNDYSYTVVGVVANVLRPSRGGEGRQGIYYSVFLPMAPTDANLNQYVLRCAPGECASVLRKARERLAGLMPLAVVSGRTFMQIREAYFADTRSMAWILVLVCVVMIAVTALGIVGLTSFWVGQRRRQIGIRRALGATRRHILHYFQTENFLLSTLGVGMGMLLAYGANLYLMQHYEMARMPWYFLPAGAVALWLIGQLAVLGPALRAARVPPVVATLSV